MIVLWIILALCLLAMVGSYLVFRIACVRGHEYPWEDNDALRKKIGPSYAALVKDGVDWLRQQQPRDLYLTSYDGLRLHARWVPAAVKTSAGVWTPRYIREKGTKIIPTPHKIRNQVR